MDLQDALRSVGWRVDLASEKVKADMQSLNTAGKKVSLLPKKKSKLLYFKLSAGASNRVKGGVRIVHPWTVHH